MKTIFRDSNQQADEGVDRMRLPPLEPRGPSEAPPCLPSESLAMGPGLGGGRWFWFALCPLRGPAWSQEEGWPWFCWVGPLLSPEGGLGLRPRGPQVVSNVSGSPHPQTGDTAMRAPGCFGARSARFCLPEASPHCRSWGPGLRSWSHPSLLV